MLNSLKTKAVHLLRGISAEEQAQAYLVNNGLKLECKNFRTKWGELDLVMKDLDTLVIVEVRYRKNDLYGSALESITQSKQNKIIAATHHYLASHPYKGALRFDVVAINSSGTLNWIKNAFQAN